MEVHSPLFNQILGQQHGTQTGSPTTRATMADGMREIVKESDLVFDLFGENGIFTPESTTGNNTDQDSGIGSPFGSFGSSLSDLSPLQLPHHEENELWESILDDIPSEIVDGDLDSSVEHQSQSWVQQTGKDNADMSWFFGGDEENQLSCNDVADNWGVTNFYDFTLHKQDLGLTSQAYTMNNSESLALDFSDASFVSDLVLEDRVEMSVSHSMAETIALPSVKIAIQPVTASFSNQNRPYKEMLKDAFSASDSDTGTTTADCTENEVASAFDMDSFMSNILGKATTSNSVSKGKVGTHINTEHDYAEKRPKNIISTGARKELGGGIVLTEEEKKLLERESTTLPENIPLTKDEEKVLKKVRRKIKNKQSAMESRRRRKDYMYNLEQRVKHCTDVNNELNTKVDELNKENRTLLNELKMLKEYCKLIKEARTIIPSTCLAVMLFSFALFLLPFSPLHYFGKASDISTDTVFNSRTLLSIPSGDDPYQYSDTSFSDSLVSNLESEGLKKMSRISEPANNKYEYSVRAYHNITLLVSNSTGRYVYAY